VQALIEVVNPLITAKAVYKVCYIEEKLEDAIIVDKTRFSSLVLRKNLDEVGRVFPYVVSIGYGVEEKISSCEDLLEQYYLDIIGNTALDKAQRYLEDLLRTRFSLNGISHMSPGSLEDWPLQEQRRLFSMFKDVESSIGVRLTESCLMIPKKSLSGIYFPAENTFYSCQLCPRKRCEVRKAPYSKDLAKEYGILK
jgi:hypothetical protein